MKVLNIGSLNIDHVYQVQAFVRAGETISSHDYQRFVGGKGCNQSIALARAGATVMHVGQVGRDGLWLKQALLENGVDASHVEESEVATGHAIIQVDHSGENCILLFGGANQQLNMACVDDALNSIGQGDYVLLQNEVNQVAEIIQKAKKQQAKLVFNPAPMTDAIKQYPLDLVDVFILNEIEGESLTGQQSPADIFEAMKARFPEATIILTLGEQGVMAYEAGQSLTIPAKAVQAVDSTGAGDTFIGYYLAMRTQGEPLESALKVAVNAAALCVARAGAAASIPLAAEVM